MFVYLNVDCDPCETYLSACGIPEGFESTVVDFFSAANPGVDISKISPQRNLYSRLAPGSEQLYSGIKLNKQAGLSRATLEFSPNDHLRTHKSQYTFFEVIFHICTSMYFGLILLSYN